MAGEPNWASIRIKCWFLTWTHLDSSGTQVAQNFWRYSQEVIVPEGVQEAYDIAELRGALQDVRVNQESHAVSYKIRGSP